MKHDLDIERVVAGGAGLARVDGVVALVQGALPGDRVRAELSERRPGLLVGGVEEVLAPGPHRRPDGEVCPRARDGSCGGCDWPAARLDAGEPLKTALVLESLTRTGRVPAAEIPSPRFLGSPRAYRLRNRLHLDAQGRLGFVAPRSHRVADLSPCELISPSLKDRLGALASLLAPAGPAELVTLEGRDGSPLLAELRCDLPLPRARALARASRAVLDGVRVVCQGGTGGTVEEGATSLVLVAGGAPFRVSVSSFFQGNRHLLDGFLQEARDAVAAAGPKERALDLYAGAGFLTRALVEAGGVVDVTAVEADASSAADLVANLDSWAAEGLARARAWHGTAEAFLRQEGITPDLVIVDPPRQGMSRSVRQDLLRLSPRALLLVSCDPPTFARDVGQLLTRYRMERLVVLDLFPGTHHVEVLSLLIRRAP